jgi:hypothetical protein
MAEEKIQLTKRDRLAVAWRSTFIKDLGTMNVCKTAGSPFQ